LFLAVQALDVPVWILRAARDREDGDRSGFTAYNPYDLIFMPYSHSLLGALAWSVLVAVIARLLLGRPAATAALVLGACVLYACWTCDATRPTCRWPANDRPVGLGCGHRDLSLAAEWWRCGPALHLVARDRRHHRRARAHHPFLGALTRCWWRRLHAGAPGPGRLCHHPRSLATSRSPPTGLGRPARAAAVRNPR